MTKQTIILQCSSGIQISPLDIIFCGMIPKLQNNSNNFAFTCICQYYFKPIKSNLFILLKPHLDLVTHSLIDPDSYVNHFPYSLCVCYFFMNITSSHALAKVVGPLAFNCVSFRLASLSLLYFLCFVNSKTSHNHTISVPGSEMNINLHSFSQCVSFRLASLSLL